MTNHELSAADFDKPTPETLAEMDKLFHEVNGFITAAPEGHVKQQTGTGDAGAVHRFIVIPRTYDNEGEVDFNASLIEQDGRVDDVLLTVTKGLTTYFFEKTPDYPESLRIEDRTPKSDLRNNPAASIMRSLQESAEAQSLGIDSLTEASARDFVMVTREVMDRLTKLR